jgi:sulfite reductase (ferredoxin)
LPNYQLDNGQWTIKNPLQFEIWKKTNVMQQKTGGLCCCIYSCANGNIGSDTSRRLIEKFKDIIADDVRITINQGLQLRFVET